MEKLKRNYQTMPENGNITPLFTAPTSIFQTN